MATYFHGSSEIQAAAAPSDGIQTLYLMNPNYLSSYSDATQQQHQQQSPNMFFFNHGNTVASNNSLSHGPPQNHHFVGIPLPVPSSNITSSAPDNHSRPSSLHGVVPSVHYNIWGSIDQNSVASAATASESSGAHDVMSSQVGFRRPVVVSPGRQGLSLSLSSQQAPAPPTPYSRAISNNEHEIQALHPHVSVVSSGDEIRLSGNSPPSVSAVSNGVSGMQNMVLGSKYLRATQELLDEVANVGKDLIKSGIIARTKEKMKMTKESLTGDGSDGSGEAVGETSAKRGADLTTAHRQELQMKKAKLVTMLDEVDQRYRQYHHQMQVVVSSFEQAAGYGAAKSYTALALQTISRQFRSLKDTIASQIRATSKSLGEEDCIGAKVEGSRLRYVDHQLRQQRALQQLGMVQHNAWRPQRGLPERAVSVLRAWLFEHFLHPYPKDSDKHMLAKQTGLTRSQVSNWFINARVRLWKPMVEEMYLEEIKEREKDGSEESGGKNENKESGSHSSAPGESSTHHMDQLKGVVLQSKQHEKPTNQNASPTRFSNPTISMSPMGASFQQQAGFTLIGPAEMEGIAQSSKKPRSGDMQHSPSSILSMDMDVKHGETSREIGVNFGGERLTKDGYPLITGSNGSFGAYPMGDLGRFNIEQLTPRFSGNSVSLTLGLPHCENLSLSGTQQNYLSSQNIQLGGRRIEIGTSEPDFSGINTSQNSHSSSGFESVDMQNRKRFPAQLLPDFVA